MKHNKTVVSLFSFALLLIGATGCGDDIKIDEDPYGGGKSPLGVKFQLRPPTPEAGYPGDEISFATEGLLDWCDPASSSYSFDFYIADEKAEIVQASDTNIVVRVPENLSSGPASITLNGQVFYGPNFDVLGSVTVDEDYAFEFATDPIYSVLPHQTNKNIYYVGGSFYEAGVDEQDRYGVAGFGQYGSLLSKGSTDFKTMSWEGQGISQEWTEHAFTNKHYVRSMSRFADGIVLMSGLLIRYDKNPDHKETEGNYTIDYANNIITANKDFSVHRKDVSILNTDMMTPKTVKAFAFQGGTNAAINRSFITSDEKIIAVGDFTEYIQSDFTLSSVYYLHYNYTKVNTIIRMDRTGNLDLEYRKGEQFTGANNRVADAYMDENDGVVIIGEFTAFDGIAVPGIVRLDADGVVDPDFLANLGGASDGTFTAIRYNRQFGKAVIVGKFTRFAGKTGNGIAVINRDGTVDDTFQCRSLSGGYPNYASILSDGKIVVSGAFDKYNGVTRRGFLILDPDGASTQRFNVPGRFSGQIYEVYETTTSMNTRGLLLMGNITYFNGAPANNVVMLETDFD
jgi:hypothetical protein